MANVTIPNLPQVTAATDLDVLVITDSGSTTTSKITKADLLSGIGGGKLVDAAGTDALSTEGNEADATGARSLIIARDNTQDGVNQGLGGVIIDGYYNRAKITSNSQSASIFVSENSEIQAGASSYSTILGGFNHVINDAERSIMGGGRNNTIGSGCDYSILFGGDYNEIKNNSAGGIIMGAFQADIDGSANAMILKGQYDQIISDSRG